MLALYCNRSVGPPGWRGVFPSSSYQNPGISWLWILDWKTRDKNPYFKEYVQLLLNFLQHPKRCGRLSIGKFLTLGHFAHLCTQIILNGCLGLTDPVSLRYLLFSFFLLLLNIHVTCICKLSLLPSPDAANASEGSTYLQLPK